MKKIFNVAAIALSCFVASTVQAQGSFAVVVTDLTATFARGKGSSELKKAEVVGVLGRSKNNLWVQRVDEPPDWETGDKKRIQRGRQPLKVLASALVSLMAFRRVSSWEAVARKAYIACDSRCDDGVSYEFDTDGSHVGLLGSNDHSLQRVGGHLHSFVDLYWAKSGATMKASKYNVFYIRGAREICDAIACGEY